MQATSRGARSPRYRGQRIAAVSPLASEVDGDVLTDMEFFSLQQQHDDRGRSPKGRSSGLSPITRAWGEEETRRRATLFARASADPAPRHAEPHPWHLIPDTDVGFDDDIRDDLETHTLRPPYQPAEPELHATALERFQGDRQGDDGLHA